MVQEFPAFDFFRDASISILLDKVNLKLFQLIGKGFNTCLSFILVA